VAIDRLAQCAGISINASRRVDSATVKYLWSYRVQGHWIGFDGNRLDRETNKTLDLRDGSEELKGMTADQIVQARRHGEAICESKANNRLCRQYGLKQKYTRTELARPFIVLKLQWVPDMSNPVVAALVTQMKLGATTLMYPQGMPSGVDPKTLPAHHVPPEIRPAGTVILDDDDDDDDDDRQRSSAAAAPRDARVEPVSGSTDQRRYTITRIQKLANPGGAPSFQLFTEQTGDQALHTEDQALIERAVLARNNGQAIHLTLREEEHPTTKTLAMWIISLTLATSSNTQLPADARYVTDVTSIDGETKGRKWTLSKISFGGGEVGATFSVDHAKTAREARDGKLPVRATLVPSERYPDQQDLTDITIIDTRQGVLPMTSEL
jgi:hypothetical protein